MKNKQFILIQEYCFFLAILFLPITQSPYFTFLSPILPDFTGKISVFPIIIGMLIGIGTQVKYKNFFINIKLFAFFAFIFLLYTFISVVHGIAIFPRWSPDTFGEATKLSSLLTYINSLGIILPEENIRFFWPAIRIFRNIVVEFFLTWGIVWWVYSLFRDRTQRAISLLTSASLCTLWLLFLYSLIEISSFSGANWAKEFLTTINPYLYEIQMNGTWWPPLLWPEMQIRTIFAEPSYLGIYLAIVLPFLWYRYIFLAKNIFLGFIYSGVCFFLIFMSHARTGIVLVLGELLLLLLLCFFSKRKDIIKIVSIAVGSACIFLGSSYLSFITQENLSCTITTSQLEPVIATGMHKNLSHDIGSLMDSQARSNRSRYGYIVACINVGLTHPFLGVGHGLLNIYLPEAFPEWSRTSGEVTTWFTKMKENGMSKNGIPNLCEYATRFGEKGILGLLITLFPIFIVGYVLLREFLARLKEGTSLLDVGMTGIAFASVCASGLSGGLHLLMGGYIVIGISLTYYRNIKKENRNYE